MSKTLDEVRKRFVEAAGHLTQSLGFGRSYGQIYAYCYFSPSPQSLDDLTEALGISKGGASMAVRHLEQWGAIRRVWIKGDRKVYYEATTVLGQIFRRILCDMMGQRLQEADHLLEDAETLLAEADEENRNELQFLRARLERFRMFRDKTRAVLTSPVVKRLMEM